MLQRQGRPCDGWLGQNGQLSSDIYSADKRCSFMLQSCCGFVFLSCSHLFTACAHSCGRCSQLLLLSTTFPCSSCHSTCQGWFKRGVSSLNPCLLTPAGSPDRRSLAPSWMWAVVSAAPAATWPRCSLRRRCRVSEKQAAMLRWRWRKTRERPINCVGFMLPCVGESVDPNHLIKCTGRNRWFCHVYDATACAYGEDALTPALQSFLPFLWLCVQALRCRPSRQTGQSDPDSDSACCSILLPLIRLCAQAARCLSSRWRGQADPNSAVPSSLVPFLPMCVQASHCLPSRWRGARSWPRSVA